MMSHLSDSVGQDVDNFFMGRGHHALAVDLDNAVTHSDPASFSDAPTHKATDLMKEQINFFTWRIRFHSYNFTELQVSFNINQNATDNAILDTEAQLVAEVGPSDEYSGHWGTSDDV